VRPGCWDPDPSRHKCHRRTLRWGHCTDCSQYTDQQPTRRIDCMSRANTSWAHRSDGFAPSSSSTLRPSAAIALASTRVRIDRIIAAPCCASSKFALDPILFAQISLEHNGERAFYHVRALGPEGIVSKRRDSGYVSSRSRTWPKVKNPNSPGVLRFQDEELG
jgi:hypothetical protein